MTILLKYVDIAKKSLWANLTLSSVILICLVLFLNFYGKLLVVKNLAKDGRYYWIFTELESRRDTDTGKIIGYTASRKSISKFVIEVIDNLYKELLDIEKQLGMEESEKYLIAFLKDKGDDMEFSNIMEEIHRFY